MPKSKNEIIKKKPIIGITGSLMIDSTRFENYWKSFVNEDYITTVLKTGGVPIIVPIIDDDEIIVEQLKIMDAIIISGGDDLHPKHYGEKLKTKNININHRRDKFDLKIAKITKDLKLPTLCICRGHQVFAVANEGTLYQDISNYKETSIIHDQYSTPDYLAHKIKIIKDSLLYQIIKKEEIKVNSFHHQIIKKMPKGFKVTAISTDGIIEAMEYEKPDYFFISVQWHPEMLGTCDDVNMLNLFKKLIKVAMNYSNIKNKMNERIEYENYK